MKILDSCGCFLTTRNAVVVNMILINMMMAIINLAFEEIKSNADAYESKFQLVEYIKRTARQVIGIEIAKPVEVNIQKKYIPLDLLYT